MRYHDRGNSGAHLRVLTGIHFPSKGRVIFGCVRLGMVRGWSFAPKFDISVPNSAGLRARHRQPCRMAPAEVPICWQRLRVECGASDFRVFLAWIFSCLRARYGMETGKYGQEEVGQGSVQEMPQRQ